MPAQRSPPTEAVTTIVGQTQRRRDRRILGLTLLVGGLLLVPALRAPFILDDYMHRAMVDGRFGAPRGPLDLYDFVNDRDRPMMLARGLLPWWSHPQLTIRFFRPLASALRYGELRLLDGQLLLPHLHSLAWWAVAVLAASALFRRTLPRRPGWIATVIFALGPWHVLPVAWLANREVLLSLAFGTMGLVAQVRFHDRRRWRDAATGTALFALAFGSGEYTLCFGGYVVALALCKTAIIDKKYKIIEIDQEHETSKPAETNEFVEIDKSARSSTNDKFATFAKLDRPLSTRLIGLLPFALPAAVYLAVRALGGYGAHGSAFYTDPLRDPGAFMIALPTRLVTLLAEGWLSLGSDAWGSDAPKWLQAVLVLGAAPLLAVALRRTLGALDPRTRSSAHWLLPGSLLSLLPVLAVAPSPRLLGVSAIGMAATIALLLDHAWFPETIAPRRGAAELTTVVATLLGFLQLVHGPATTWLSARELRRGSLASQRSVDELRVRLGDVAHAEVAVARGGPVMFFGPLALDPGGSLPRRWWILSHTTHVLALRKGPRTIELVAPPDAGLYPPGAGNLFRSADAPLRAGEIVELPGMRVQILAADRLGTHRARFTFEHDLDKPPLVWVDEAWEGGFRDLTPPAIGFGQPLDP